MTPPSTSDKKPLLPGQAWCHAHNCHPETCWEIHNPAIQNVKRAETAEEAEARIQASHLKGQSQLIRIEACGHWSRDPSKHKCSGKEEGEGKEQHPG